ncbi:MAG: DUF6602 domain-containing protein [Paraburkholderia tropica]
MWATFQESGASSRPDHKGGPREEHVRRFLRERLPSKWGITRGHIFHGDTASNEFDVLVYDALSCPSWTLDNTSDPRRLIPLHAVIGVIEVKSTLDGTTLEGALGKLAEFDELIAQIEYEGPYSARPFRHVFAYQLDPTADFEGWHTPALRLTSYAGTRCQPDGLFILNDGFAVLDYGNAVARSFALHRGMTVDESRWSSWDLDDEEMRRSLETDPSYCNDYFATTATNGLLLLAFLTFVLESAARFVTPDINYADEFCRWGGPQLDGLLDFRSRPDPYSSSYSLPDVWI